MSSAPIAGGTAVNGGGAAGGVGASAGAFNSRLLPAMPRASPTPSDNAIVTVLLIEILPFRPCWPAIGLEGYQLGGTDERLRRIVRAAVRLCWGETQKCPIELLKWRFARQNDCYRMRAARPARVPKE